MNVVIYARYSSHNQNDQSIEGQLAVCKEYALRNNYNIVGEYIDRATSGTNDNRPQFLKMIEDSNKKQFEGVLVYQLDRFARNRYDSATYKAKLKKNGVRVFSARENINDDASGVLMESVLEGMAEYFSVELGQKVKRGMKINADNCYYNGGTVPLGYKLVDVVSNVTDALGRNVKKRKLAVDELTAPIVRKIFEMYLDGYLMADIIRYLNDKGYKTSIGKEFNKNSIRNILTNKRYIGIYTYNGIDTIDGIPRIIDNDSFERVQDKINVNKNAPQRAKAKTEYLLTTKLFCGYCKEMMTGYSGTSKSGKLYTYYMCKSALKKKCKKEKIGKDIIEELVVTQARNILTDENINLIANEIVRICNSQKDNSTIKALKKLIKENERQKENLFNSLKLCTIETVQQSIFEEINKMEIEHKRLLSELAYEESQNVTITASQVKFYYKQLRKGSVNDYRYKKLLIKSMVKKVFLYDDYMLVYFNTQKEEHLAKIPTIIDVEDCFDSSSCSFVGNPALPEGNKL